MHGPYAEMIRTHFMHLVPPRITNLPPCTARYGLAVLLCMFRRMCMWRSPLQSYFRLNAPRRWPV